VHVHFTWSIGQLSSALTLTLFIFGIEIKIIVGVLGRCALVNVIERAWMYCGLFRIRAGGLDGVVTKLQI